MSSIGSILSVLREHKSAGVAPSLREPAASGDYLQERLGLLAGVLCTLGTFVLIAGCLHQLQFLGTWPFARGALDPALVTHVLVTLLQLGIWVGARRRVFGAKVLPVVDAVLVLGSLSARGYEACHLSLSSAHHVYLLMCMTTLVALLSRAVIIPSRPRTTLLIGALAVIPTLLVAWQEGTWRGSAAEALSHSAIWSCMSMALSTFTSHVIYGLRRTAQLGRQLGQYVLERKLGQGGMGEVYLARHTLLRRPTALKLLPPERVGQQTIARFEREVRTTSLLSHPNTVAIYDYGRTSDGIFYYAMEHLDGCDLQRLVGESGRLGSARVVHILVQVLGALSEAHAAGLVHRDLKPANVFLCERGGVPDTVKVLDFGLVKVTGAIGEDAVQTDVNVLMGTPAYLAPEAIHSPAEVDARCDLYAVGALGYFLLTGREVFEGGSVIAQCMAHLHEAPVRPSERIGVELPRDLEEVILSCLQKNPDDRPQRARAVRRALLACDLPPWQDERTSLIAEKSSVVGDARVA